MSSQKPVVAAIPHYNMPKTLTRLLRQVLAQGYSQVYVLDDNSKNCRIEDVLKPFGNAVKLISGKQNLGAGGNRNRMLSVDADKLRGAILHFIDADCELLSSGMPDLARKIFRDKSLGAVAGLVLNADNSQYPFNFGPRLSRLFPLSARLQKTVAASSPKIAKLLRIFFKFTLKQWPDTSKPPMACDAYYLTEANLLVSYATFAQVGGFDGKLRYHEAQDLARKLSDLGLQRWFDPSIAVKHHAVQVRPNRLAEKAHGLKHLIQKYGIPLW